MYVSYDELQGFRSSWAGEGEEIEEKFNSTANTDDPLFCIGSSNSWKVRLEIAQMMTKLVPSFLTYASGIVARSDPKIFSVFKAKDGHFP